MCQLLTSEQVVFQAPLLHVFIDKEELFLLPTVPQELYEIWMAELPQEFNLCLSS